MDKYVTADKLNKLYQEGCAPKYIEMPTDEGIAWVAGGTVTSARCMTYGNGMYVCGCNIGTIGYSTDGISWSWVYPVISEDLIAIAYGNGKFVAISEEGSTCYSTNGTTWTAGGATGSDKLGYVTYGSGKFVIACLNGNTYYSTDGAAWTAGTGIVGEYGNGFPRDITYGNGKFVIIGQNAVYEHTTYYSTDGINWTASSEIISEKLYSVIYGKDKFVAFGADGITYYSTDGVTWTAGGTAGSEQLIDMAYGDGKFVAINSNGGTYYSFDGIEWAAGNTAGSDRLMSITYGNDKFLIINQDDDVYISTPAMIDREMEEAVREMSGDIDALGDDIDELRDIITPSFITKHGGAKSIPNATTTSTNSITITRGVWYVAANVRWDALNSSGVRNIYVVGNETATDGTAAHEGNMDRLLDTIHGTDKAFETQVVHGIIRSSSEKNLYLHVYQNSDSTLETSYNTLVAYKLSNNFV